jgi:hypothetical protein
VTDGAREKIAALIAEQAGITPRKIAGVLEREMNVKISDETVRRVRRRLLIAEATAAEAVTPVGETGPKPELETVVLVAEAQERKKEKELGRETKERSDKKVERSQGYLDKLAARERQVSRQRKRGSRTATTDRPTPSDAGQTTSAGEDAGQGREL